MPDPLDPSQKAAEPLKPVKPADLARTVNAKQEAVSPEEKDNRENAANEVSMIFELNSSVAFRWFEAEFIDRPFRDAFEALRTPGIKAEDLPAIQQKYMSLRAVKVGIIEREISHRDLLDPNDSMIPVLREKLARL